MKYYNAVIIGGVFFTGGAQGIGDFFASPGEKRRLQNGALGKNAREELVLYLTLYPGEKTELP